MLKGEILKRYGRPADFKANILFSLKHCPLPLVMERPMTGPGKFDTLPQGSQALKDRRLCLSSCSKS
jgi:hypothetical protein